jgi:hypothetical protein
MVIYPNRHGDEYVSPFLSMLWGLEGDLENLSGKKVLRSDNLRRAFDFLIALEEPVLRGEEL